MRTETMTQEQTLNNRSKNTTLIIEGVSFFASIIFLAGVYIYGINISLVHRLETEHIRHEILAAKDDMHILEAERARSSLGFSLQNEAEKLGLSNTGPVHYVHRGDTFARLSP